MLVATAIVTECTTKKCQICVKTEVVTDSFDCDCRWKAWPVCLDDGAAWHSDKSWCC